MSFHVGQKVVCVDDHGTERLSKGMIYTVTGLIDWPSISGLDGEIVTAGVKLAEVEAVGDGFDARRFRPVVTRKTDISIFKAMLNPSKERVKA